MSEAISPGALPAPADWERVVIAWIRDQPPPVFAHWASAEQDIVPTLVGQWPPMMRRLAQGWLGPKTVRYLRAAGPAEFQRVVDRLAAGGGLTGQWAWAREAWLVGQLMAARDAFLAE